MSSKRLTSPTPIQQLDDALQMIAHARRLRERGQETIAGTNTQVTRAPERVQGNAPVLAPASSSSSIAARRVRKSSRR